VNFHAKVSSVVPVSDPPVCRVSIAASVNRIAMGSLAALSISMVEASRFGRAWRRRIEKVAAASVEDIITDRRSDSSKLHFRIYRRAAKLIPAVSTTPQVASPPAGRATALKLSFRVPKPPLKRMKIRAAFAI
jgi:hypothetical protein